MSGIFVILAVSSGGSRPSDNEGGGGIIRPRGGVGLPGGGGRVHRAPPQDPPLVSKQ